MSQASRLPDPSRSAARSCARAFRALCLGGSLLFGVGTVACGDAEAGPAAGKGGKKGPPRAGGKYGGAKGGGKTGGPSALLVEATGLQTRNLVRHYESSGTLRALRFAEIRPVQTGVILSLSFEEGELVKEGAVLARLDGRDASLAAARDELTAKNAQRELDRLQGAQQGAFSAEEIDKQRYELESARAAARVSRHQVGQMQVRAPFAGTITRRLVDIGNLSSASSVIYELSDTSALELDLYLPELEAAGVRTGAEVRLELLDKSEFTARVQRRAPTVDAQTGTVKFTVRATELPAGAVPGAFARAKIVTAQADGAWSLPRSAIFEIEGRSQVYRIVEGRARRTPVQLGLSAQDHVEIREGLKQDEQVITQATGITEGMAVKTEADAPEPPAAVSGASWKSKG